MSENEIYSDEHINSYVDGELDCDERARLVYDEQHDAALAERINHARMLKEKVQLAYDHIDRPASRQKSHGSSSLFYRGGAAIAAVVLASLTVLMLTINTDDGRLEEARTLVASTAAISAEQLTTQNTLDNNIIIDLNQYDPSTFDATLTNIESLVESSASYVEIIANGPGVNALDTTSSAHADAIAALAERYRNLDIVVCAQSLSDVSLTNSTISMIASALTTPTALEQIARRHTQGWYYLKLK